MSAARLDDGRANLAAGTRGCGRREDAPAAVDVLFVDEAGQISLANVVAMSRAPRQPRPARRPAAARPAAAGHAPARAPSGRRSPTSSATRRRCRPSAACSSRRPGASTRTSARSPRRCSTTTGSSPSRTSAVQRRRRAPTARRRGRAAADRRRRRRAPTTRSPDEADAVAELAPSARRRRRDLDRRARRRRSRSTLDGRPRRRAVQRPGRRRSGGSLPPEARVGTVDKFQGQEAPISIYSMTTSSPGARAARHGLPVQPPPAQRGDVAGALRRDRRRLAGPAARARPDPGADAAGQRVLPVRGLAELLYLASLPAAPDAQIGRVRQVGPPEPLIPISRRGIGVDLAAGGRQGDRGHAGSPRP